MQFARRLRAVWSWLPAFRAVAETEHLPSAARELSVVPSALSRSVHLLEEELGRELFDRTGKALVLNDAGRRLLAAVRDAMRTLDDALADAAADELRGIVTAVACADLAAFVLAPAQAALATSHPQLVVEIDAVREELIEGMLLRGDADAALVARPREHPDLAVAQVASWTRAAYVAAGHPLARGDAIAEPRAVVVGARGHEVDDGWPIDLPRSIAAWVPDERAALETCLRSPYVTVAFDAVAATARAQGRLVRLDQPAIAARPLFLVHRRPVATHPRTEALAAAIRGAIDA
jgi:DNA-binding transcriptional LysR family regulator